MTKSNNSVKVVNTGGTLGGIFLVTYIGAAVYFIQQTHGFWGVCLALLKAAVWPAFVLYRALVLLKVG